LADNSNNFQFIVSKAPPEFLGVVHIIRNALGGRES
jgi:hypothetical protein